jgi:hypothetical protein
MKNSTQKNVNNSTINYIPFIIIIALLLIVIAYMLGNTNRINTASQVIPTQMNVIDSPTPTAIPKPQFDVQGCINRANAIFSACQNSCQSGATNQGNQCPKNNLTVQQNCLNQALLLATGCFNNCLSTSKISINNCRNGINN